MPGAHQPPYHIPPHPSQTDHSKLHLSSPFFILAQEIEILGIHPFEIAFLNPLSAPFFHRGEPEFRRR